MQAPILTSFSKDGVSGTSTDWDVEYTQRKTVLTAILCLIGGMWLSLSAILLLLRFKEKWNRQRSEPPPRLTKLQTEWRQNGPRLSMLRLLLAAIWLLISGALLGIAILRFAFPTYSFELSSGDQRHITLPWSLGGTMLCAGLRIHSQNAAVPTSINLLPVGGLSEESPVAKRTTRIQIIKASDISGIVDKNKNLSSQVRSAESAVQTFEFFLLPKWNDATSHGTTISGRVSAKSWLWTVEGRQRFIACKTALSLLNLDGINSLEMPQLSACGTQEAALVVNPDEDFKYQIQIHSVHGEYVFLVFLLKDVIPPSKGIHFKLEVKRHVLHVSTANRRVIPGQAVHLRSTPVGLVIDFNSKGTSLNFTSPATTFVTMNCDVDGRLLALVFSIIPLITALLYYSCMCGFHNTLSSCNISWFEKRCGRSTEHYDDFGDIYINKRRRNIGKFPSNMASQVDAQSMCSALKPRHTSAKRFAVRSYSRMTPSRPAPLPPVYRKHKHHKKLKASGENAYPQNSNVSVWASQFQQMDSKSEPLNVQCSHGTRV